MIRQMFIIAPKGASQLREAIKGQLHALNYHHWAAEGDNPLTDQVVGVLELYPRTDEEVIIDLLEANGIMWLPNHLSGEKIKPEHAAALAKHGVLSTHTTAEAMDIVHSKSGFPPLKPQRKRF